ncbi:siderophore-interacting protein [Streptomyces sp. NPDC051684]|uniref:siderophore-interacting protein n=1 Tax=Streptomyces sp. NPDC051684 TaxID=3365670 RepID=UPI0037A26D39
MQRGNLTATRVKPESARPLRLHVLRSERLSPHFARVTLGGDDIADFRPMGYDQWFRLFLPAGPDADASLGRVPDRLTTVSYLKLLGGPKETRPVLRNYTVSAHRAEGPQGPELDVDFVLHGHGDDGAAGPAATWAEHCGPGDPVVLFDEGTGFNLPEGVRHVALAAEESGLPALAGVLASLPGDTTGWAVAEVPTSEDRRKLTAPPGIEVVWVDRGGRESPVPGAAALERAGQLSLPDGPLYGWAVGESGLATGLRRHWVAQGVPKERIMFCGYWKR